MPGTLHVVARRARRVSLAELMGRSSTQLPDGKVERRRELEKAHHHARFHLFGQLTGISFDNDLDNDRGEFTEIIFF